MNSRSRNLIVIVLVVLVVIGAVLFFVSQLGRGSLLPGRAASPTPSPITKSQISEVRLTALGPIVANEQFVSLKLTVNGNQRTFTSYGTYTNQVINTQTLGNNPDAYSQFLDAEINAGFMRTVKGKSSPTPDSSCPQGTRYIYETVNADGTVLTSLWTSTCGDSGQNFGGDSGLVNTLFKLQFPGIDDTLGNPPLNRLSL